MSVLGTLSKIIPPPAHMRLPSAGVDISDTSLKYVQFQPDKRIGTQLQLQYWGDIDIADGVLNRGTVTDVKKLSEAIAEVKERTGAETARVSLPEERAYLFETEIKRDTPLKEIRGLLEFHLEENVPLSPRDAFFDYDILAGDSKNMMRVSVTAYARETIMSYYEACIGAGVTPLQFEVEAQAIARATIPVGDKGTHIIVDFGKTRTGIGIVYNGVLMYTSTIDIGGDSLSTALRSQLGGKEESELTRIKNTQGLVRGVEGTDVYDALLPTMSAIIDEVRTRLQYWNMRDLARDDRQIQSVILCGGSVNMKGLPEYFSEMLKVDAKRAQVWQNVGSIQDTVPEIGRRYSYGYATAVGLALTPFL
ncbi:MAG: type IV pilus assembly protein PilM [Acidimicrobiales bacterium]|jgi:type IV pilus assembly protein PilM